MTCLESFVGFSEISQWPLDLTRPKQAFAQHRTGEEVGLPSSEDDKCIARVFGKFQLSKETIFEMPHRVLNLFSQCI